ncbi:MAG: hypothetical protein ACO32E_11045 [Ilumatobacteraceae bacterium]
MEESLFQTGRSTGFENVVDLGGNIGSELARALGLTTLRSRPRLPSTLGCRQCGLAHRTFVDPHFRHAFHWRLFDTFAHLSSPTGTDCGASTFGLVFRFALVVTDLTRRQPPRSSTGSTAATIVTPAVTRSAAGITTTSIGTGVITAIISSIVTSIGTGAITAIIATIVTASRITATIITATIIGATAGSFLGTIGGPTITAFVTTGTTRTSTGRTGAGRTSASRT